MRARVPVRARPPAGNGQAVIPHRHGLSGGITATVKGAKDIESLARRIAGEGADTAILELARSVAHAEFEFVQIRRLKVALIARMSEFGEFEARKPLVTLRDVNRMLTSYHGTRPRRRHRNCRLQNRSAQPKPCAGRCRNWSNLSVTSGEPSPDGTGSVARWSLEECY